MSNEVIFLITATAAFLFIRLCFVQGRRWLQASVVVNLLLISVFGAKLVSVFGVVTNVGNIFYAAVFLAAQLISEHFGRDEGRRAVSLGVTFVAFFVAMGQLVVRYAGAPEGAEAAEAIATLFQFTPRLALASVIAYFFSQSLNVEVFSRLRERGSALWLRSLAATTLGQLADSVLFFSVAFWGTVPQEIFFQALGVGFLTKFALGAASVLFLYSSYAVKTKREILEEEAAAILLGIGDGVVMTDRRGKILIVNRAFEELLGWRADEVTGRQMTEIVRRYDEAGNAVRFEERVLTRVLLGGKIVTPATNHTYFERRDGTRFPARIVVTPVRIDHSIMGAVEVFHDVTREREIERLRADFLMLASHQLRTPLSGTRWLIETLKKGLLGELNARQREYLDDLYSINTRMNRLVADMLKTLRIESGDIAVARERVSILELFDEALTMMRPAAEAKRLTIAEPLKTRGAMIAETDLKLAKSIAAALLSNAIGYSSPGGTVTLDAEDRGHEIVLSVKDEGIGIPHDEQKRIFERFYRASNASAMKPDGTGLGLSIASVLAKRIGARITFESVEHRGSIFFLHFPK